jgi:hypothetical protein
MTLEYNARLESKARGRLPWLKMDATALMLDWPRKPGRLPFSGRFWAEQAGSAKVMVTDGLSEALDELFQTGSTERDLGSWIWRIDGGGVRFDLETTATKIEYHPLGRQPCSFLADSRVGNELRTSEGDVEFGMERFVELETQW